MSMELRESRGRFTQVGTCESSELKGGKPRDTSKACGPAGTPRPARSAAPQPPF